MHDELASLLTVDDAAELLAAHRVALVRALDANRVLAELLARAWADFLAADAMIEANQRLRTGETWRQVRRARWRKFSRCLLQALSEADLSVTLEVGYRLRAS